MVSYFFAVPSNFTLDSYPGIHYCNAYYNADPLQEQKKKE
jgi:hypothetical protein